MWIVGLVLIAVAVGGIFLAHRRKARLHAMIAAETLPIQELEDHRRTLVELGTEGGFRKVCEVVGAAAPAPHGPLRSELTGTECVWHRHTVVRRDRVTDHDEDGDHRTRESSTTVVDVTSGQGYALTDETGIIGVDPAGVAPDRPEQVHRRFEPAGPGGMPGGMFGGMYGGMYGGWEHRAETIGFEYAEWVIRPGQRLYILGEVHDRIGPLVIGKPESSADPFVISTRTESELRATEQRSQRIFAIGGAALGVIGLALVVLGLVL